MLIILILFFKKIIDAEDLFATLIFLCDGYFEVDQSANEKTQQFFDLVSRVPYDVQQLICQRYANHMRSTISNEKVRNSICTIMNSMYGVETEHGLL